ncbi:MAG: hypothetical protein ACI9G1_003610 [Pirellulaceae bacterium]|jgi:hypothetical protein
MKDALVNTTPEADAFETGNSETGNSETGNSDPALSERRKGENDGDRPAALDNPYVILAILFLALGAVGIPFLNRSNAFSDAAKKRLTVLVIIYTVLVVLLLIAVVVGFIAIMVYSLTS